MYLSIRWWVKATEAKLCFYLPTMYPYYELSGMTYLSANRQTYCDVTYYADRHVRVYYTWESDTRVPWHLIDKIVTLPEANDSSAICITCIISSLNHRTNEINTSDVSTIPITSVSLCVTLHNIFWAFFANFQLTSGELIIKKR